MTHRERPDTEEPRTPEYADELVDEWGQDSFPASDPPGEVPPTLEEADGDEPESSEDPAGPYV
ncbi:MAG TPA: hypothetical protein VF246_08665 [Acidimicrobiia bacterium]